MGWHEDFGFYKDPFSLAPLESDYTLIGRDREAKEVLYRIESGNMLIIEGSPGTGKTALLKHTIDNFRGEGKVVYIDGARISKRFDVQNLLRKRGMIVLMDNVHFLSGKNSLKIKHHFDNDNIKSVVFTAADYSSVSFANSIKDRIGRNIIRLNPLKPASALKIAKERLNGSKILPDSVLRRLYADSGRNIKEFLKNCGLLCSYVASQKGSKAKIEDIKKMPKHDEANAEDITEKCQECSKKLVRIGDNWRCGNCDRYCSSCGALADGKKCQECEA